jgi:hypothetical protein
MQQRELTVDHHDAVLAHRSGPVLANIDISTECLFSITTIGEMMMLCGK